MFALIGAFAMALVCAGGFALGTGLGAGLFPLCVGVVLQAFVQAHLERLAGDGATDDGRIETDNWTVGSFASLDEDGLPVYVVPGKGIQPVNYVQVAKFDGKRVVLIGGDENGEGRSV